MFHSTISTILNVDRLNGGIAVDGLYKVVTELCERIDMVYFRSIETTTLVTHGVLRHMSLNLRSDLITHQSGHLGERTLGE
jgi:hypothetical protein